MPAKPRLALTLSLALGLALRLWFTFTTFGTDDVQYKALSAELAMRYGVVEAYSHSIYLNHPLLGVLEMIAVVRLADATGIPFGDVFRVTQITADLLSFVCLLAIGRRLGVGDAPAIFFFLSPPAILISGFHGNTDSTMVALTVLAASLMPRRPAWAGAALAAATSVKVIPLLAVPLFFFAARQRRWRFVGGWCAGMGLLFGVPALLGGLAFLRNTFLYRGVGNWWGVVSMLVMAGRGHDWLHRWLPIVQGADPFIIVALVLVVAAMLWRALRSPADEERDLRLLLVAIGLVMIVPLVAGTGFGVQYLVWPVPFLPLLTRRPVQITVVGLMTVFLIVVYTHWSGGFPWFFANSVRPDATTDAMVVAGWVVWAALAVVLVDGGRRLAQTPYGGVAT